MNFYSKNQINKLIFNKSYLLLFMILLLATILLSILFSTKSLAFSLNPNSGNLQIGTNQTIQIVASGVPPGANTANLYISLTGPCNVQSFTASSGLLELGTFTSKQICKSVGLSGGGSFTNGQVLATFVVNCSGTGTLTLETDQNCVDGNLPGPGYAVPGGSFVERNGTLGTFSVSNNVPNTSISFLNLSILIGSLLLITGFKLFKNKKIKN